MRKISSHHEDQHQRALASWALFQPVLRGRFMHIPNGGQRTRLQGALMKAAGTLRGVADNFIAIARSGYHGLWVELKAPRPFKSVVSPEQKEFLVNMRKEGYAIAVCYGWMPATDIILAYLAGRWNDDDQAY